MSDIVRGAALSSGDKPPQYDVIAPAVGEVWDLTTLDTFVIVVACHWVIDPKTRAGRSRRCYIEEGDCPHCDDKARKLRLGWVGCIENQRRKKVILRMGEESTKAFVNAIPRGQKPRGRRWEVRRTSAGSTAQLSFKPHRLEAEAPLPREFNLEPTLCLVLGCDFIPGYTYSVEEIRERGEQ